MRASASSTPTGRQPNLLVILTDQQHSQMMSCAGNPWVKTPAMDSLAAGGTRFTRAYCANPVCVPSRFTLFTGQMPSVIGMWGNQKPVTELTAESFEREGIGWKLREAGYETAYGGKVHIPLRIRPEGLGFENITADEREGLAQVSADYLRERADQDQPFCLVTSFINPHDICYMAIRDFATSDMDHRLVEKGVKELAALDEALQLPEGMSEETFFDQVCPPLPANYEPQEDEPEAIQDLVQLREFRAKARAQYTDRQWRMHRWAYARLTERVDAQIGQVLEALHESGQADNTVVIFTSDHGDHDASHRMEHKDCAYEEASAVPLLVRHPGKTPAGHIESALVSNGLDLIPTLCDYAGIEKPANLKGASFRSLAEAEPDAVRREALIGESQVGRMVVTERYKYVMHHHGERAEQLYDLKKDPGETRNFAHDSDQQAALNRHRALFAERFPEPGPATLPS